MTKQAYSQELLEAVSSDPSLAPQQKQELLTILNDGDKLPKLLSGTLGAAVGVAIGKYRKLSNSSKILLGLAGFGIGRLMYNILHKRDKQFVSYNDKLKTYEMDSTRN